MDGKTFLQNATTRIKELAFDTRFCCAYTSAIKVAGAEGFEPPFTAPKTVVLPLDDTPVTRLILPDA